MPHTSTVKRFHIRIELKHVEPPIWREVVVPADISLGWLHEVIQITMGWTDSHLHEFEHNRTRYGQPMDEDFIETVDEDTVPLHDLFKRKGSRLTYTYDFGDGWEHDVSLVETLKLPAEVAAETHPFAYIGGARACPPEDCGGPWGYQDLLKLLQLREDKGENALDPEQLDQLEWLGAFNPQQTPTPGTVKRQLGKIGNWLPEPADEDAFDGEVDDGEFDDFMEFMAFAARGITEGETEAGASDPTEEDEAIPEPYSSLSADDAGAYASSLKLAAQVREAEPWKQLHDCDIFGIEDPETGEFDIVSVLGSGDEVFSIQVHRPPSALHFWKIALTAPESMTRNFIFENSRIIEAEFVNKRDMEPHDLQLYTTTDTKPPGKGRQRWIRFRSYASRIFPQFGSLNDLPALDRGLHLCLRHLESLKEHGGAGQIPDPVSDSLPVYRLTDGDPGTPSNWTLKLIPVDWQSCQPPSKVYKPTEFEIAQLASYPKQEETWELGSVFLPTPVATEEGPVICVVSAVASHASGAPAPAPHIDSEPQNKPAQALWNCLAEAVATCGHLPAELRVSSGHAYETLLPLAEQAGIQLKQFEHCELVDPMLQMLSMLPPPGSG